MDGRIEDALALLADIKEIPLVTDLQDCGIDLLPRLREGRQVAMDGNRGDVLRIQPGTRWDHDAELSQQTLEALLGKGRGSKFVATAVKTDYQSVTDNLRDRVLAAGQLTEVVHSDHCPVWTEFAL